MTYTYLGGSRAGQTVFTPIAVNGKPIPPPASMPTTLADLHANSERTASGLLVADKIRSNVVKFELPYNSLSPEDLNNLINIFGSLMWKSITYLHIDGTYRTITGYKGDIQYSPYGMIDENHYSVITDISVSLIQR